MRFRILSLKTKDTSASSWLFNFVTFIGAQRIEKGVDKIVHGPPYGILRYRPAGTEENHSCIQSEI